MKKLFWLGILAVSLFCSFGKVVASEDPLMDKLIGIYFERIRKTELFSDDVIEYRKAMLSEKMEEDQRTSGGGNSSSQAMEVFTYMQSNLESNTEALSEMSEKPIEDIDRDTMLNFVACTNTLVDNLRKGIQSGLASSAYTRILRFSK